MMVHGLIVAVVVSLGWILLQNLLMHVRPSENRMLAMVTGYLMSLPFVFVLYRWMPMVGGTMGHSESFAMGLVNAYFLHMMLFFQYGNCFYHVERSVTIRFLVELLKHGDRGAAMDTIQTQYSLDEMIQQRMEVMRDRGLVELRGKTWYLRPKGLLLARIAIIGSWLFQMKGQHERM
jgi:hypothetical protein